jgi:hypothetical protein
MPRAALPTTLKGWLVALAASFVGLIAGFIAIAVLSRALGNG